MGGRGGVVVVLVLTPKSKVQAGAQVLGPLGWMPNLLLEKLVYLFESQSVNDLSPGSSFPAHLQVIHKNQG